jgi:hypothetical protein
VEAPISTTTLDYHNFCLISYINFKYKLTVHDFIEANVYINLCILFLFGRPQFAPPPLV